MTTVVAMLWVSAVAGFLWGQWERRPLNASTLVAAPFVGAFALAVGPFVLARWVLANEDLD